MALPLIPVAAAGESNNPADPCGGVSITPPDAYMNPKCLEDKEKDDFDVDPVLKGNSVVVTWAYHADVEKDAVEGFVVFRGPTPSTMEPIGVVEDAEDHRFVDDERSLKAQADVWYAVAAQYDDGLDRSASYLVQAEAN